MTRVLFHLNERSASASLCSILLKTPGNYEVWKKQKLQCPVWLPTIPEKSCKFFLENYFDNKVSNLIFRKTSKNEAYARNYIYNLDNSWYNRLPNPSDWKFVHLLRDPRNRTESRFLLKTSPKRTKNLRESFFKEHCRRTKLEMSSLKEMLEEDHRFFVLKFEDFVINQIKTMTKVFDFIGFKADTDFLKEHCLVKQTKYIKSSFGDRGVGGLKRWDNWSTLEKNLFKRELGELMHYFGYEDNENW